MTKGKNKKISKNAGKKKQSENHPFLKKEWLKVISSKACGAAQNVGWTCIKKPTGTQKINDLLHGRILEICLGDVKDGKKDVKNLSKKIKLYVEDVQGNNCITSFNKFELTRDQIQKTIRKRRTLVDISVDVKTKDGNNLRVFVQIVSGRSEGQVKLNAYLVQSQIKAIRKAVCELLTAKAVGSSSDEFVNHILYEKINKELNETVSKIHRHFTLQVTKVKMVKKENFDEVNLKDLKLEEEIKA